MKTLRTISILILLFTGFFAKAQINEAFELVISEGTEVSREIPMRGNPLSSYAQHIQMIYPVDSLEWIRGGLIKKIAFHARESYANFETSGVIRFMETPETSLYELLNIDDATKVFEGWIKIEDHQMTFILDPPFEYKEDNLLIDFQVSSLYIYQGVGFYGSHYIGAAYNYMEQGPFPNMPTNFLPKLTFYYEISVYTIIVTAGSGGSISPDKIGRYPVGSKPKFTITPDTGYEINQVLVDGVNITENLVKIREGVFSYTFEALNADHEISATFKPKISNIQENPLQNVQVYSHGNTVYIINESPISLKSVEITDISGRVVYSSMSVQSPMNLNLAEGQYIVRLMSNDTVLNTTILIR